MKYKITVNEEPKKMSHIYEFDYGKIKHITLRLAKGRLSVELETKAKKSADQFFTDKNNYFSEALKKGMLFHLLLYSTPLPTHNIRIFINDKELSDWNPGKSPVIYSLISKKLEPKLSKEWQEADTVFQYFCKNHKTQQKDLAASLYALLYSKTRESATERFMYLWVSMNGLYNHLAKLKDPSIDSESEKIKILGNSEGWGTGFVPRKKKEKLCGLIDSAFINFGFATDIFYDKLKTALLNFPPDGHPYKITLDGYLNLWYPYYLRCNMFHAGKPIALFAMADEFEIKRLEFINKRLDSYLDNNLWKYFDENYCKEKIDNIS